MNRIGWLLAALVMAALVPAMLGGSELLPRLRSFPPGLLLALFGMIVLCWTLNAMRLRLLLGSQGEKIGRLRSLGVIMATEFAICSTPGGSGGPLTLMALLSRDRVRPAHSGAVFAMDQLNDLLFFLFAVLGIVVYTLFHSFNRSLEGLLISSAVLMLATLGLGLVLVRWRRGVMRFNGRLLKRVKVSPLTRRRWARRLLHFFRAFRATLRLPRRVLALVFGLTCLHWALRYSVLYLVLIGLGGNLQWITSFLVQVLSLSAGQVSLLPGGAGAAELTSATLLTPMVGKSTAAAAVLVWRVVTYYFYLVAGGPVFLWLLGRPLLERITR
ncbi:MULTISPECIES: YbhN family protein [unclassified Pseudomonas]|uniref:lysylphosphatidylglycerol synthase transmembrane domain-containing protein n=1 Tax=unclassified Pseudomonas TaxID=196821 RepID=UPI0021C59326|nr:MULTISPECIES: lysylphosphatidylglycerol synthase transmembrane domain-containing protein [unclassified Pseudomonas]MCU1732029.1 flippase-like domain-containing protein [Pseudomonas sp. 20P_3.2_Bac4]MCU1745895.1 flippase-like domain-containing protein [Pseudomonas sp. 20P_3.2_Bac5]